MTLETEAQPKKVISDEEWAQRTEVLVFIQNKPGYKISFCQRSPKDGDHLLEIRRIRKGMMDAGLVLTLDVEGRVHYGEAFHPNQAREAFEEAMQALPAFFRERIET
jgi:hypothetical protein